MQWSIGPGLVKTTRFLFFPGFLLGFLVCCAAGSPEPVQTLSGTDLMPGIRQPAFSGVLTDAQFRLVIRGASQLRDDESVFTARPVRLSLDLPTIVPLPRSGELSIRTDAGSSSTLPVKERVRHGTESAERVNVEAMRDYRERWKKSLDEFSPRPLPILYPSTIQRTLENTK